jgi:hypothetical protein
LWLREVVPDRLKPAKRDRFGEYLHHLTWSARERMISIREAADAPLKTSWTSVLTGK